MDQKIYVPEERNISDRIPKEINKSILFIPKIMKKNIPIKDIVPDRKRFLAKFSLTIFFGVLS